MADDFFSLKDLRARGWTDRLVRVFLANPDKTIANPYQRTGRPKRLYAVQRVQLIESSLTFTQEKERSAGYSARLKGGADTKRENLVALVNSLQLPPFFDSIETLLEKACDKRKANPHLWIHSEGRLALEDLLVTMKSLDWHLDAFAWHPGIRNARKLLRTRMLAHIVNHYPTLAQVARERAIQEEGNAEEW